jgi:hypothetical protein
MTDRLNGVWVAFEKDIREDDAETTINAIRQIRGVLVVEKHVADPMAWIGEERVRQELGKKIFEILFPGRLKL